MGLTRLQREILQFLDAHGATSAEDVATALDQSRQLIHHHANVLREAGLLIVVRRGRQSVLARRTLTKEEERRFMDSLLLDMLDWMATHERAQESHIVSAMVARGHKRATVQHGLLRLWRLGLLGTRRDRGRRLYYCK